MELQKEAEEVTIDHIVKKEFIAPLVTGFINIGTENTTMPEMFADIAEYIKTFEMHDSDVVVATYPRSGTTWTQEMVWLIANNFDFKSAKVPLTKRFPFLEMSGIFNFKNRDEVVGKASTEAYYDSIEYTRAMNPPRFIKTHLPFSLLPIDIQSRKKSPKIIYVIRNPKDSCVSFYHLSKGLFTYKSDLENFGKVYLAGKFMYGSYWKHVLGYWEQREMPNLLFITYDDMIKNLPSVVKKVAHFLGKGVSESNMERLCNHLDFKTMQNNSAVNRESTIQCWNPTAPPDAYFIRSGTIGKHKEEMSREMNEKFDAWIKCNLERSTFKEAYGYIF